MERARFVSRGGYEAYSLLRDLRFSRFKIEFRDSILATLNSALVIVGRKMGFEAQLQISGLPTLSEIEKAEQALCDGGTMKDIYDVFSMYA